MSFSTTSAAMQLQRYHFLSLLFLFSFFCRLSSCFSDDTTSFVFAGCSQAKYTPNTPYQYNLNSLLASLANSASMSTFANFTSNLASPSSPAYGLYQCRGDLPIPTCHQCIRSSIIQLSPLCNFSTSAAVQLRGCVIRYGNDSFLGKPGKTLLYRRCGATATTISNGYEADLVGMREGVLEALLEGSRQTAGLYKAGRVGYVDGVAQCIGDQSEEECRECVAEAVKEMRSICGGPALSGEVYLEKCYVVYEAKGGVYPSSSSSSMTRSGVSDGGNGKLISKQMVMIIGIAAALLLLVLCLYFLGRSRSSKMEGKNIYYSVLEFLSITVLLHTFFFTSGKS